MLQALAELFDWLEDFGLSGNRFKSQKQIILHIGQPASASPIVDRMRQLPSLATAQANFAALREELHMSDAQVR